MIARGIDCAKLMKQQCSHYNVAAVRGMGVSH